MTMSSETTAARQSTTGLWPWALAAGGVLFLIGGPLHPSSDSSLPESQATAEFIGAATWVPSHALILLAAVGYLIGLFGLARSPMPLSTAARRSARVAAAGGVLLAVESIFHLGAFLDEDAALAGNATPILSTHLALSLVVYPIFTFAVAALAVLSRDALTHPVVGIIGAIGAIAFGLAPALVGAAGIETLAVLFPIGGVIMALWFTVVGVTALIRGSARRTVATPAGDGHGSTLPV